MLTIEVKLNGKVIANAELTNLSGLADLSDYELKWTEAGSADLGIDDVCGQATITAHRRRQSAWALVAKAVVFILEDLADWKRRK